MFVLNLHLRNALVVMGLLLTLTACGADNSNPPATATPLPTLEMLTRAASTATAVAPTATITVAPTASVLAPLATRHIVVVSTAVPPTAANDVPTFTVEPDGAATSAAIDDPTGDLVVPAATMPSGPTPPVPANGRIATAAEVALISEAFTNTKNLNSYHITETAEGEIFGGAAALESDFVAPDNVYVSGTLMGQPVEDLARAGVRYKKQNGVWVATGKTSTDTSFEALGSQTNVLLALQIYYEAGKNFRNRGVAPLNGVNTTHFIGDLDSLKMTSYLSGIAEAPTIFSLLNALGEMPSLGKLEIWIDADSRLIHKIAVRVGSSDFDEAVRERDEERSGTPLPSEPLPTPIAALIYNTVAVITRHNDPLITVPEP